MAENIRTRLRDARRKRLPLPEKQSPEKPAKIPRQDYPTTGDFFTVDASEQIYEEKCSECGRTMRARTQQDNAAEYITYVTVQCICGAGVGFVFPVG